MGCCHVSVLQVVVSGLIVYRKRKMNRSIPQ
nr:MAG TPA: hypothetical protein [Caudoviricetes sp.]DAU85702.1 MAG TPA: hypothetical protein [Caudoviricetes sp.]